MRSLTTGQIIVDALVRHGVDTLFGIPGAHTYHFFDALHKQRSRIRLIHTRHEQAAGYMAYGYARSSGRVGAYSVVPGPGVLNSAAALATAYGANEPVLCITGEIFSDQIGRGHGILHELPDQLATLRLLTKWSERIDNPADAPEVMAKAFRQLTTGRTRPVAVETPWDVFGMRGLVDLDVSVAVPEPAQPDPDRIRAAEKLLNTARNPMIMVGAGARHAGAEVQALAKLLQAPVVAHRGGRGIVSEKLPYGFSCADGYALWPSTDLVVGIGTRLELPYFRWKPALHSFALVRIDIDPAEMTRRPSDVGIVADARLGTRALVDALSSSIGLRPSREAEFEAVKSMIRARIQTVQPQMRFLNEIRDVLPSDGFAVVPAAPMAFPPVFMFPCIDPNMWVIFAFL